MTTSDTGPITCEVDDVEWVRFFTRHGVPRPAKACLISPRPPQPQGLPRHPQWRGRQGPHGASQGSSRTSGGRPQPHTQGASTHTNLPRSSTPNGFPAERSTNKYMQCHNTNTKTYDLRKRQLSLGDCGSTLHTSGSPGRPRSDRLGTPGPPTCRTPPCAPRGRRRCRLSPATARKMTTTMTTRDYGDAVTSLCCGSSACPRENLGGGHLERSPRGSPR